MENLKVIGKNVLRLDAVEKVTGKAKFGADFKMSGMLYAKVLRSPYPHARVTRINTSKAETLGGVRAVLTAKDVPPIPISPFLGDQYALCSGDIVRCVGDPLAAVAADNINIAEEAIGLIEVDYEELPAVFDAEEALKPNPPVIVHPDLPKYKALTTLPIRLNPERPNCCQTYKIRIGDVEKGFQDADLIVESRFTTARIQHAPIEPHVAMAWFEPDRSLTIRSSCQLPHDVMSKLSEFFNLSPSMVRVLSPYIGGGFGGKASLKAEAIAALLAQKSGRPVKLVYTREDMFVFGGHRPPYILDIKDGVTKDGTLIAREIRMILALGAYSDFGILLVRRSPAGAVGTYRVPNFKLDSYGVYTNLPLTCALRGFGSPEISWAIEQQMDIISEKLGIDSVQIRRKNILNEGDRDVSGMVTHSIGVRQCLDKVAEWIGWGGKAVEGSSRWRRGKGIAIGSKSVIAGSTSVVIVKVWQDGMIEVRHSATQLGQGIDTTLAQIAAEQFGVSTNSVKVVSGDTAFCPFDFGTAASRSLIHNGNALISACQDAKLQLFRLAAPKLKTVPDDLVTANGEIYVKGSIGRSIRITDLFTPLGIPLEGGEIIGRGSYTGPIMAENPQTGQSERSVFDHSYTANAVEIAVDVETGEIKVLRSCLACDVGKAINPKIVEGQMEGGIGMGIGTTIYEEVVLNEGKVVNASFVDYHIPTTIDMPKGGDFDTETIIVEAPEPEGPFGAKGVGELVLVAPAPAIANALYNAVGIRIKDLPLSKEKVLWALKKLEHSK